MTQPTTEINVDDIFKTRLWFYDFLGKALYMEPEKSSLEDISILNVFEQLLVEEAADNHGLILLKNFFKDVPKMNIDEWKNLKSDYARLFVGPGHLLATPWGSVYLSKERIIFDEHTLEVREYFKNWGVKRKTKNKEPDDHIGYELEFISILIDKSLKELENSNVNNFNKTVEAQKEFLEKHVLTWVDEFSDNLSKGASSDLYKGLALFLPEFLKMDYEFLEDFSSKLTDIKQ